MEKDRREAPGRRAGEDAQATWEESDLSSGDDAVSKTEAAVSDFAFARQWRTTRTNGRIDKKDVSDRVVALTVMQAPPILRT